MGPKRDISAYFVFSRTSTPSTDIFSGRTSEKQRSRESTDREGTEQTREPGPRPAAKTTAGISSSAARTGQTWSQQSRSSSGDCKRRISSDGQSEVPDSDCDSESPDEEVRRPPVTQPRFYLPIKQNPLRKPPTTTTGTNDSLKWLVESAKKSAKKEQRIAALKADLNKSIDNTVKGDLTIDEETLAGVVQDEEEGDDKAKRLYLAMQRTNALESDPSFHFFRSEPGPLLHMPFPAHSLTDFPGPDPFEIDDAFLSGYAQQLFSHQGLPEELAIWMTVQICAGPDRGLCPRYLELLQSNFQRMRNILTPKVLRSIFSSIGGDTWQIKEEIRPTLAEHQGHAKSVPRQLANILRLLRAAAPCCDMEFDFRQEALLLLLHIVFDNTVRSDVDTLISVQDTIEALMHKLREDHKAIYDNLIDSFCKRLHHPILQHKLVSSLSTRSGTTHSFRRHLALAFLLYPTIPMPSLDNDDANPYDISDTINNLLRTSPIFQVNRKTSHSALAASISLLDIAIGPGPIKPPVPPAKLPSSPPPTREETLEYEREVLKYERGIIPFNKRIDALVQDIKVNIGNKIVEAGAISDLSRLEAKDAVERLCHRLESAVRVGGRRKRGFFSEKEEVGRGVKRMFGWLKSGEKGGEITVGGSSEE
ncbi:hypothetical protein M011DRAFT_469135 [Sporormia fimetaria CBS 119925]|uniref:Uncharacterized protein n=1 Tax=Sporormia fimetaria CBS 119925 TaxID=1340428 RepID=A0A6A6V815_9PLEO|nr:hypothetical protein M011DRAFT_469135 [Sporormia fimetaria CBS 119925]